MNDANLEALLSWVPFLAMLLLVIILSRKSMGKQKIMMDVQQKAYQELQNINKALAEISQKLDKK
jgi:hypothetical protein